MLQKIHIEDIFLDHRSCIDIGLYPVKPPTIVSPSRQYNEQEIPGRDGKFYEDLGTYEDITLTVEFNFRSRNKKTVDQFFREYKRIIRKAKVFSKQSDPTVFYKIKKTEIGELDRGTSNSIGTFSVDFTFDPYAYLLDGVVPLNYKRVTWNEYDESKPIYILSGEGRCTLTVNGKSLECNCTDTIYIDTDLELAYREDKSWVSQMVKGYYDELYLIPGKNTISITQGFDLKVIPNWRYEP